MIRKASEMTLNNLFEVSTKDGDFLQTHRMVISSADAWGTLCRDLIMALGIERAKRFLLRYGYTCGVHEAKMLKELFKWENNKEWLLAGVRMHNISGRSSSVPTKLNIDTENGVFDVEGYWFNSYEAKQYLQHFPPHHESVCYFLAGYAGGYCSTALGKKVVFKEVECIGKGDEHCHFIGKTLELWGDEIYSELIDYEQEDIGDELDRAYKRIERQREILKRGTTLSNELTRIVLQGKGLEAIAQTLGKSLQCGVMIENQHFETIAEYGDVSNYSMKNIIENVKKLDPSQREKINRMIKDRITIQLNIPDVLGLTHYRLVTPIVVRNQIYGYVSLIKTSEEVGELEPSFIERASNICALQILNERTVIETEQRMKGELLDELLRQPNQNSYAAKRLSYLGYNLNKPHYVFIFQLQNQNVNLEDDHSLTHAKNLIIEVLRKQASHAGQNILVSNRLDQVRALIPEDLMKKESPNISIYGKDLLERIRGEISPLQLLIGISNRCVEISHFNKGFKEASKAIEIAKLKGQNQQVILFSELGHIAILLDARNPEELESYANEILGPIYDYDTRYSTELLKTLYYYVNNECNLYKTARIMNVSIGGMRYRLTRIKELFGLDLTISSTRFEVQMSLDIYLVLGKIHFY
jgi:purine catabolism regulator